MTGPCSAGHRYDDGMAHSPSAGILGSTQARNLAVVVAASRVGLGVAALLAPARVLRPWVGDSADQPGMGALGRALAGRDVALGLGTLMAARQGRGIRAWVEAGALSDTVDSTSTLLGWGELPARGRILVLAASIGAALAGGVAARSL